MSTALTTPVANTGSQALTQPPASVQPSPVSEPISGEQTDIALVPGVTADQVAKVPKQFRDAHELLVKDHSTVKSERDELATQLADLKPAAEELEKLGGLPYIRDAVDASNLYLGIASIPLDGNNQITQKHRDAGQKFVDKIYEISPPSGEIMEQVMNQLYGGRAWDQFADWLFHHKPSDAEVAAVQAFIDGGYQTQTIVAPAQGDTLPPYCYATDYEGNRTEIPEAVAAYKRDQANLKRLETQVKSLADQQNAKTAAQKATEEQTKTQQEAERLKNYERDAFKPVEDAVLRAFPDAATNPKAKDLRLYLEHVARSEGGDSLKTGLDHARLGQTGAANGKLAGIQAKIRLAVGSAVTTWQQMQGAPTIQQQLDKVKNADSALVDAKSDGIPYRPERSDYPNDLKGDEKWRYEKAVHRATYKTRFPDEQSYIKQTTRPSAA